ncbi:MAG: hypothetical protein XD82_1743, partial [Methanoculleus marisnigri]
DIFRTFFGRIGHLALGGLRAHEWSERRGSPHSLLRVPLPHKPCIPPLADTRPYFAGVVDRLPGITDRTPPEISFTHANIRWSSSPGSGRTGVATLLYMVLQRGVQTLFVCELSAALGDCRLIDKSRFSIFFVCNRFENTRFAPIVHAIRAIFQCTVLPPAFRTFVM